MQYHRFGWSVLSLDTDVVLERYLLHAWTKRWPDKNDFSHRDKNNRRQVIALSYSFHRPFNQTTTRSRAAGKSKDEQAPQRGDIVNAVDEMFHANRGSAFGPGIASRDGAMMKGQMKWRIRERPYIGMERPSSHYRSCHPHRIPLSHLLKHLLPPSILTRSQSQSKPQYVFEIGTGVFELCIRDAHELSVV